MRRWMFVALIAALSIADASGASAKLLCKSPTGKFIKCPPASTSLPKAAPCKNAKGKFIKCSAPGAAVTAPPLSSAAPKTLARQAAAPTAPTAPSSSPLGATAKCKDGAFSHSQHHSGLCSHHGGVASFL